ncbi:DUF4912 domain-containing protein [Iningainema tapete]|nr:DUF4912 domain-containing protein [Iningainema tapete]
MFRSKNHSRKKFVQILVVVLALTATPKLLSLSSTLLEPVFAQSNSPSPIPLPQSLPSGTTVKVDGSSSMRVINEALKKRFEEKFSGTKVELASGGTDQALAALLRGDINLAAVGRPLTNQEKAQGLITTPISREKIAIIVGSDNPFNQNLTFDQFAKMFRGEITDWKQVGGKPGQIKFIDHPEFSDTRRSLSTYDNFKKFPFKNGANTTRLAQDDTTTIVQALGKDGISYAIADQVINLPNVRVIPMHKTLPNDPRYPYSQPRGYVSRKENAAVGTLAYLGFATSAPGQEIVAAAKQQEAEAVRQTTTTTAPSPASPVATTTPNPGATTETALVPPSSSNTIAVEREREFPWWLLLLAGIPLLGLLWWLLRRGQGGTAVVEDNYTTPRTTSTNTNLTGTIPPTSVNTTITDTTAPITNTTTTQDTTRETTPSETPVTPVGFGVDRATGLGIAGLTTGALGAGAILAGRRLGSRITLEPHNLREANAIWSAPQADRDLAKQQGGRQFQLRVYDVTGINLDTQAPHNMQSYDCDEISQQRLISIPRSDRDYVAEIGYVTPEDRWLLLARSNPVRIAAPPVEQPTHHAEQQPTEALASNITLELRDSREAEAVWFAPQAHRDAAKQQGGRRFQLRIYDATNINLDTPLLYSTQSYDCDELERSQRIIPIAQSDHDYVAEIGYLTTWGQWLILARSNTVRVNSISETITPEIPEPPEVDPVEPRERLLTTTGSNGLTQNQLDPNIAIPGVAGVIATGAAGAIATGAAARHLPSSRITLEPSTLNQANAQWLVPPADQEWALQQGGQQFELRIYDATNIDEDTQPTRIVQSYECDEHTQQQQVLLPESDRDYVAEIGYLTEDEEWLRLARSNRVRITTTTSSPTRIQESPNNLTNNQSNLNIAIPAVAGAIATGAVRRHSLSSRITLEPISSTEANAQWLVPPADREWALQQGGQQFELRIYDATNTAMHTQPARIVQSYECDENIQDYQISLPASDRDYVAEIGYLTEDEEWLRLACSNTVRIVGVTSHDEITQHQINNTIHESSTAQTQSRVAVTNDSEQNLWVQWFVESAERETAYHQGGQTFQLRIYDATHINLDTQLAQNVYFYNCDESSKQCLVSVPVGDRDYVAEIGYVTSSDQWLRIARSNHVRVPSFEIQHNRVTQRSGCKVQHLTIHSRHNCFLLGNEQMRKLQETAVTKTLEPGIYVVRIKSGSFGESEASLTNQPIVLLWIYGRIINKKTNLLVPATWSSLNGYDDTLTLEVVETSNLCAFFFDSFVDDNDGEIIVSVIRLYSNN